MLAIDQPQKRARKNSFMRKTRSKSGGHFRIEVAEQNEIHQDLKWL
jgi:hypothetical protein